VKRDHPRAIDRFIDYFGEPPRLNGRGRAPSNATALSVRGVAS
jgi:hypothetical protein